MNTAEVLERAADLIEERGWWQQDEECEQGDSLCAQLAIAAAKTEIEFEYMERFVPEQLLMEHLGIESTRNWLDPLFNWNDDPIRTKEQVVKELRSCAASLREVDA